MGNISERLGVSTEGFQLGSHIDYSLGSQFAFEKAKTALQKNQIARITNFPLDKAVLTNFASQFGSLLPKYRSTGNTPEDYVGDVMIRTDIPDAERLLTEGGSELRPHTAKSWSANRPAYFGLLMVDPGWIDQPFGLNGESRFVKAEDILHEMQKTFFETFIEDTDLLFTTPVSFTATHIQDQIASEPLLFSLGQQGMTGIRYKENMIEVIRQILPATTKDQRYLEALKRFDESAQNAPHISLQLTSGDLILIDNRVVMHARNPFVSERLDEKGQRKYNPRHLFNIHIQAA